MRDILPRSVDWIIFLTGALIFGKGVAEVLNSYSAKNLHFDLWMRHVYTYWDGPVALFMIVFCLWFGGWLMASAAAFAKPR
jgi:hypothetical protein